MVATWSAFAVFLTLLLFAVQVLTNLWTASVVTAAASDAARQVASRGDDEAARLAAEAAFRRTLGGYAGRVTVFEWREPDNADAVVLHVETRNPSFVLRAFVDTSALLPFQHLDRTFRVRRERFR